MQKYKLIILSLVSIAVSGDGLLQQCKPKIAIIGGGIGGASAAHFITELFNDSVEIDLFEANKIGGRLATVNIKDNEYEAGGAIIHDRNQLMKRFLRLLELEARPSSSTESQLYGIWNGDDFVFQESNYETMTIAKLVYRYGLDPVYLHSYVKSILDDFEKIYQLQDDGHGFVNVTDMLSAMSDQFPSMLGISINDHLQSLGYSSRVINELVQATLVVNYGQEIDVQSFVGCVSVAGAGSSLWSVKGGNNRVVEGLIKKHEHIRTRPFIVEKITYNQKYDWSDKSMAPDNYPYTLTYKAQEDTHQLTDKYDVVIIATPLTSDQQMPIEFVNFSNRENFIFSGNYQTTWATFIDGQLNATYFGLDESIQGILSCNPEKTLINSVGKLSSIQGQDSNVWKIFSRNPLSLNTIKSMFFKMDDKIGPITHEWKAYPKYTKNDRPGNFKLHNALYHVNAIEWAASAMEMSAIGGRNVAILAHNDYTDHCKLFKGFESKKRKLNSKTEL